MRLRVHCSIAVENRSHYRIFVLYFFQNTREGCGCPRFLAGKVFRVILTLWEIFFSDFPTAPNAIPAKVWGIFGKRRRADTQCPTPYPKDPVVLKTLQVVNHLSNKDHKSCGKNENKRN